ncbi:autotransporter outer membrane beta-barrel domain-containing protein [Aquimarina sp. AU58]|uniref:autotransporter outer membrane beta-barrel domain-containing protein n=1 Tax=Aquimarina sp. AU58 TaxID=1874112 RepID=UPI000D6E74DA|nr:autotransporter outer membrane beta-barrel domain-containing protein [Aquimarina sp. AU58]
MKKVATLIVSFIFIVSSQAQDSGFDAKTKGSFIANGSVNVYFTTRKRNDDKATAFTTRITPKVGYFVIDNLAVGLELGINTNKEKQDSDFGDIETTTNGFGIGPFARYYLENNIYFEGLIGIASSKTTSNGGLLGSTDIKSNIFGFRVGAGYAFFLGNHVAIEPSVSYSWEDVNPKGAPSGYKESLSSIFLGIGISAFF